MKTAEEIQKIIEDEAYKEEIYEPKYGGKDHSGYDTMMLYEVNSERSECFEKGANFGFKLAMEEYRSQPHLPAINALSQKMYGCDYSEVHLPERRAELLEMYLGIRREAE